MTNDPNNDNLTDSEAPADEQLVAYLDGELDDEASREIEQRLSTDENLRDQLGRLERTWDALDQLDQIEVGETFTRTTLEMVTVAAEEDQREEEQQEPVRRRRRGFLTAAGLFVSCLAGFGVVWGFLPDPNQQLLEDLPVIEQLDEYEQIDEIEFLELLHKRGLFAPEAENDSA